MKIHLVSHVIGDRIQPKALGLELMPGRSWTYRTYPDIARVSLDCWIGYLTEFRQSKHSGKLWAFCILFIL